MHQNTWKIKTHFRGDYPDPFSKQSIGVGCLTDEINQNAGIVLEIFEVTPPKHFRKKMINNRKNIRKCLKDTKQNAEGETPDPFQARTKSTHSHYKFLTAPPDVAA